MKTLLKLIAIHSIKLMIKSKSLKAAKMDIFHSIVFIREREGGGKNEKRRKEIVSQE